MKNCWTSSALNCNQHVNVVGITSFARVNLDLPACTVTRGLLHRPGDIGALRKHCRHCRSVSVGPVAIFILYLSYILPSIIFKGKAKKNPKTFLGFMEYAYAINKAEALSFIGEPTHPLIWEILPKPYLWCSHTIHKIATSFPPFLQNSKHILVIADSKLFYNCFCVYLFNQSMCVHKSKPLNLPHFQDISAGTWQKFNSFCLKSFNIWVSEESGQSRLM